MHLVTNDHDLVNKLVVYALTQTAHLPQDAQTRIKNSATVGAPGDRIVETAEVLYAHYDLLNAQDKEVLASCFACGAKNGWSMLTDNQRAEKVVGMAMNDCGVVSPLCPAPAAGEEPEPQAHRREGSVNWKASAAEAAAKPAAPATR